jgi:hypothetical protein
MCSLSCARPRLPAARCVPRRGYGGVQIRAELRVRPCGRSDGDPYHHIRTGRDDSEAIVQQVTQTSAYPISRHRVTYRARYDETDTHPIPERRVNYLAGLPPRRLLSGQDVHHETTTAGPAACLDHRGELVPTAQTMPDREHVLVPKPYADRRARPLNRREERTARPARVRMRSRKPWVFARRRLFGWYVRLLTVDAFRVLPATNATVVTLAYQGQQDNQGYSVRLRAPKRPRRRPQGPSEHNGRTSGGRSHPRGTKHTTTHQCRHRTSHGRNRLTGRRLSRCGQRC